MISIVLRNMDFELLPFPEMVEASRWFAANESPLLASLLWREGDDITNEEEELRAELQRANPPDQSPAKYLLNIFEPGAGSESTVVVTSEGLAVIKSSLTAEQESELIRASAKTQAAQLPHPFQAAKWTHPNGHPRCRVCGCEETVDGTCPGLKAEPVRFGPGAAESVKVATSEGIVVAKFNPYHDTEGRFSSGSGTAASSELEQTGEEDPATAWHKSFLQANQGGRKALTSDEKQAIRSYRTKKVCYETNRNLREGGTGGKLTPNLDSAISKFKTNESVGVFRGVPGKEARANLQNNVGKLVQDKGFVSTSLYQDVAETFMGSSGTIVHISVPKGASALMTLSDTATYSGERELILPRNSVFRVESVRSIEGKLGDYEARLTWVGVAP